MKKSLLFFGALCLAGAVSGQGWVELTGSNSLNANNYIYNILTDNTGAVYVSGQFLNAQNGGYVAKFSNNSWSELGGTNGADLNGPILAMCMNAANNLYIGGGYDTQDGETYVRRFNGTSWTSNGDVCIGSQYCDDVVDMCMDPAGNVYAVGLFEYNGGGFFVSKWNGSVWTDLPGLSPNERIEHICSDPSGNIYASGHFTNASGNVYIAKWNGTSWSELGGPNSLGTFEDPIYEMKSGSDGKIYVTSPGLYDGTYYSISVFDGTSWSTLSGTGTFHANEPIEAICFDNLGNIYAAGHFTNSLGLPYVAKYNGSTWSETGNSAMSFYSSILTLASDADNNIYAGGMFMNLQAKQYVAKLSAAASGIGENEAVRITVSPNPVTEMLNVTGDFTSADFEIMTLEGKIVKSGKLENRQIVLSDLGTGVYFLKVQTQDFDEVVKFVKS